MMVSKAMIFQTMVLLTILLFIRSAAGAPDGCICRRPDFSPGVNVGCDLRGCSNGTNHANCNNGAVVLVYRLPPAYSRIPRLLTTGGCNCPHRNTRYHGYFDVTGVVNAADGRTVDGFGDADDVTYDYTTCATFGRNLRPFGASAEDISRATACCSFCCERRISTY